MEHAILNFHPELKDFYDLFEQKQIGDEQVSLISSINTDTPTTYRTEYQLIGSSHYSTRIQFLDKDTWRYVPNPTYANKYHFIDHELPTTLKPTHKGLRFLIENLKPKNNILCNYEQLSPLPNYPIHYHFSQTYPHISQYLRPQNTFEKINSL